MSFVERYIILCPYLRGSTIGGSTVYIALWGTTNDLIGQEPGHRLIISLTLAMRSRQRCGPGGGESLRSPRWAVGNNRRGLDCMCVSHTGCTRERTCYRIGE